MLHIKQREPVRQGTIEEKATLDLSAEDDVEIIVEYNNSPPPNTDDGTGGSSQPGLMRGVVRKSLLYLLKCLAHETEASRRL